MSSWASQGTENQGSGKRGLGMPHWAPPPNAFTLYCVPGVCWPSVTHIPELPWAKNPTAVTPCGAPGWRTAEPGWKEARSKRSQENRVWGLR